MITINSKEAKAAGFRPLTVTYHLPREQGMLDNVLTDMRRGDMSHVLVRNRSGVAVWRRGGRSMEQGAECVEPDGRRTEDSRHKSEVRGRRRPLKHQPDR